MPRTMPTIPPKKAPGAPPALPPSKSTRQAKRFTSAAWTGSGQGEKIVVYGGSGVGKTSLLAMMPGAVFLGLDDGGRKIRDGRTGEPITVVEGVQTFADVRDAIHQTDLWPKGSSCVIDTGTLLENWAEPWMFDNIKHEKGGTVTSIEGYGYGKGFVHLFDTMRLILQDLDALIRRGVNVGIACQSMAIRRANPGGTDYLYDGPKLSHPTSEKFSTRLHVCEWADHVVKIDFIGTGVQAGKTDRVGKAVAAGEVQRAVFTMPEPHFFAKTRSLLHPVIAFAQADDDSLWRLLFEEIA